MILLNGSVLLWQSDAGTYAWYVNKEPWRNCDEATHDKRHPQSFEKLGFKREASLVPEVWTWGLPAQVTCGYGEASPSHQGVDTEGWEESSHKA